MQKNLKIAILTEETAIGGGQKFSINLGDFLRRHGHHVAIVAAKSGNWHDLPGRYGLDVWHAPTGVGATVAHKARAMAAYLNSGGFDIVLLNAGDVNRIGHLATRMLPDRIGVVMIFHGGWPRLYELARKERESWNVAVGVGPDSFAGATAALPGRPVFGITNGVELPDLTQIATRRDWELPLRLLFVGRLVDPHKGIFRLPRILQACRQRGLPVHLTVIGDGPDRRHLMESFAAAGLGDESVHMAGAYQPEQIAAAARDHHLFVFPTNTEGMPLALLEAQANGCVPVTTYLSGVTDVAVEQNVSGRLVAPGDIAGFADQIAAMMDPETWRRHSLAGIERTRMEFSVKAMGTQYLDLIQELAAGRYPKARSSGLSRRSPFKLFDHLLLPAFEPRMLPEPVFRSALRVRAGLRRILPKSWIGKVRYY